MRSPIAEFDGYALGVRIALVPILRAGGEMVDPLLEIMPDASVRHLGIFREKGTLQPTEYYNRLPAKPDCDLALILDRTSLTAHAC